MPSEEERRLAADPGTSLAKLASLANEYPELRPTIALNPSSYEALLNWMAELNDPQVDKALQERAESQSKSVVIPPMPTSSKPSEDTVMRGKESPAPTPEELIRHAKNGKVAGEVLDGGPKKDTRSSKGKPSADRTTSSETGKSGWIRTHPKLATLVIGVTFLLAIASIAILIIYLVNPRMISGIFGDSSTPSATSKPIQVESPTAEPEVAPLTPEGYQDFRLGMELEQAKVVAPGLVIGKISGNVQEAKSDETKLIFRDNQLWAISPNADTPTSEGIKSGDRLDDAIVIYGTPIFGNDSDESYATFASSPLKQSAYRVYFNPDKPGGNTGTITRITLCHCQLVEDGK